MLIAICRSETDRCGNLAIEKPKSVDFENGLFRVLDKQVKIESLTLCKLGTRNREVERIRLCYGDRASFTGAEVDRVELALGRSGAEHRVCLDPSDLRGYH